MREVLRGIIFGCVGVLLLAQPAHAAETVVTAQVAGVRHIVVDRRGIVREIVSNTAENVAPIAHLDSLTGVQVAMSVDTMRQYESLIAQADVSRAGVVYSYKPPFKKLLANLARVSISALKPTI